MGWPVRTLALAVVATASVIAPAVGSTPPWTPTVMSVVYEPDICWDGPDYLFAANSARSWEVKLDGYVGDWIAPAPTGDRVAYSAGTERLRIERVAGGRPVGPSVRVAGNYWGTVHWAADGRRLFAEGPGNAHTKRAWMIDAATGQRTRLALPANANVITAEVPASGPAVVLYTVRSRTRIAVVEPGRRHFVARIEDSDFTYLAIAPDGRWLAFEDGDGRPVQVVDLRGQAKRRSIRPPAHTQLTRFRWVQAGRTLALSYARQSPSHARGGLMLVPSGARARTLPGVSLLDVTPSGMLATTALHGRLTSEVRVRTGNGQVVRRLDLGTTVATASWIEGRWLAVTSSEDAVVRAADTYTGRVTRLAALPKNRFDEPSISPLGAHAADC